MANMKQNIDNHNRKIISNEREREKFTRTCNCRDKTLCPLKGKCLQEGAVYKAIVTQTESMKQDIDLGMTEDTTSTIPVLVSPTKDHQPPSVNTCVH